MPKDAKPLVTVIIPAFNEDRTIKEIVDAVVDNVRNPFEVVVIDDGSTDQTPNIVKELVNTNIQLLIHPKNQGKTAAISSGISIARGEILVIQDADLEYIPKEINDLISPIEAGIADVVYGSRFRGSKPHRVMYYWHYLANQGLTTLSNIFTNLNLTDMETGYKAFRRNMVLDLKLIESGFGLEPEITAKLANRKARFYEIGIEYHGRTYEEGKKITWRDGVQAVWIIFKYGWLYRIKPWLLT